jgi:hypothetical protein
VGKVQKDGISEIEAERIRQLKNGWRISWVDVKEDDGTGSNLSELLRGKDRVLAVNPGQNALRLKEHPGRRKPAGVCAQELLACGPGRVPVQQAVDEDHRIKPA